MATVNIIWSLTNNGTAITDVVDCGNVTNNDTTTVETFFIRHDGSAAITAVKFYIRQYSGTYSGGASAAGDIAELLGWADAATAAAFGGVFLNMYATEDPTAFTTNWPTLGTKSPDYGSAFRTGVGDTADNGITLVAQSSATDTVDGTITNAIKDHSFQIKVTVPEDEDTTGVREFELICAYTYTS